ncbi:MAG: hypothetical protein IKJ52_08545 [Muribaculaceae bacterium]|nr:hypothetical protein [Muribaculaceae bacterium]
MNIVLALFWVWCTFGFISEEIAPFLLSIESPLFFLFDVVMLFLGFLVLKDKWDKIFVISFLVLGYGITCIYNGYGAGFYANGLREFVYLISLLPILRYLYESEIEEEFVKRFDRTLFIFLIVQALCITFQFVKYGANDHGGGSMGNGFSGIVSILIYIVSFYLLKKRMDPERYVGSLIENKWLVILLYPTFLNETKISFIFFILYFILLMPIDRRMFVRLMVSSPIVIAIVIILFNVYTSATGNKDDVMSVDYYMNEYLFAGDDNDIVDWMEYLYDHGEDLAIDGSNDLPRFTKIALIPELNAEYPGHAITGYGIGQFKGGTMIARSEFYMDNEWLLRGSVPYCYQMYIQIGLFALMFFTWMWFRLSSLRIKEKKIELGIIAFVVIQVLIILFYNDMLAYCFPSLVFFYIFTQALRWNSEENKTIETT